MQMLSPMLGLQVNQFLFPFKASFLRSSGAFSMTIACSDEHAHDTGKMPGAVLTIQKFSIHIISNGTEYFYDSNIKSNNHHHGHNQYCGYHITSLYYMLMLTVEVIELISVNPENIQILHINILKVKTRRYTLILMFVIKSLGIRSIM